jgi:peptide subunit release factor 1 (eRF1)
MRLKTHYFNEPAPPETREYIMISREDLQALAAFKCEAPNELAISFYFQPEKPKDRSHREEAILGKDVVRGAMHQLRLNGRNRAAVQDLERIVQLTEGLHGNSARGKAVFACESRGFWREYDLPEVLSPTMLNVNRRFHLKPLAPVFSENPLLWVAVIQRQTGKFYELQFGRLREVAACDEVIPRHGHSDGFGGYDAGHSERHQEDDVRRHFRRAADIMKNGAEKKQFEALVIATHDVNWPEIEAQLHPEARKRLLGRFVPDSARLTENKIKTAAEEVLREALDRHHQELIRETLDEAKANGRGVTGLRRVLRAMEFREVDKLVMTQGYSAKAVECASCGHLDSHMVPYCPVCGRATRELDDVCEALVPAAIRNHLQLVVVPANDNLDRVGNIAAMLRFRADRNTNRLLAAS